MDVLNYFQKQGIVPTIVIWMYLITFEKVIRFVCKAGRYIDINKYVVLLTTHVYISKVNKFQCSLRIRLSVICCQHIFNTFLHW